MISWLCLVSIGHGQVTITEFMASNSRTLTDADGEYSDWIELLNSGSSAVNLEGWYLTDSATNRTKWRCPAVTLSPNRYLIVFASGKDRTAAGSQLHTNFKISTSGEYLGLVKPDGVTVTSEYGPSFPVQLTDVSYGLPTKQTVTRLISAGAPAKFLVPTSDALAKSWTETDWNDLDWQSVVTGIGFETGERPTIPVPLADSANDFSGVQGRDNWFYGYYNKTADKVSGYQTEDFTRFPRGEGAHSMSNYWNGASWKWFNGDPPWTEIGQTFMLPNGINSGDEQWPIRRWVSPVNGTITVQWHVAKQNANGNGVTGRVYYNGFQKDQAIIAGRDVIGIVKTNSIVGVQVGDFVDFALAPTGTANATDDSSDGSYLTATIQMATNLASQVTTSVETSMKGVNSSAYLRVPFVVNDPSKFQFLTLRMKYNDGFVAYLNGVEVANRNAPFEPVWNSAALTSRDKTNSVQFEEIDLSSRIGLLHIGANVLAIHGLNAGANDADFLIVPELSATSLIMDPGSKSYLSFPTPGSPNSVARTHLGPIFTDVTHAPKVPSDEQDLLVTATAAPTFHPIRQLTLTYRVMYGAEVTVPMFDDGLHADGLAGDRVFGAVIPANVSTNGQMVRYFIKAEDTSGEVSRWPPYQDAKNSPQYFGTMVSDPTVTSALPVLYWFIQNRTGADSETGTRSSVFYLGQLYDNVGVKLHGQSSTGFPKKSYDFDFNRGYHFRYSPVETPVEDFHLLTTYPDKSQVRNILAYDTYRDAGSTYHIVFPVRVQQNGAFFSVAHFCEKGNEDYLARLGLDPRGALYKMYNTLDSATSNVEKETRKYEKNTDLQALVTGSRKSGAAKTQYLFDNINMPAMVNFLAAMIITGGVDCCHKNYYAYRDTEGTGEWQYLPWDVDLTFGRNWNSANTYFDDTMFSGNGLFIGDNNTLIAALFNTPSVRQMYLRRIRTLMDSMLQPTNTPFADFKYERRIDELATLIMPDAGLDYAKWTTWGQKQTMPQAIKILTNQYFPARRNYLSKLSEIPKTQPTNAIVDFGSIEVSPISGNQGEEFIQLTNSNTYAVDLSGWKLAGGLAHTFAPGTVMSSKSSMYVSPNVNAFRARKAAPAGAQGLFVVGNYKGQLSARGGTVRLLDDTGREAAALAYPGNPSAPQQSLRITEIMFHPLPAPTGSPFQAEDFEFLLLKNVGPTNLDLAGVRFSSGITFTFTGSSVTLLAPGESLYLAKNPAAFTARYGRGFSVVGPYDGNLDNAGEKIRLDDAAGESILEFAYDPSWFAGIDGLGFSLAVLDEKAPASAWNEKSGWRANAIVNGSPILGPTALKAWRATHFTAAEIGDSKMSGDDADPDKDGRTNMEEFLSGTDPRDARSYFKVEAAELTRGAPSGVKIRFNAVAGKSYTIQQSDSLSRPNWSKLIDIPTRSSSGAVEITAPVETNLTRRYYRIITPRQPSP